ncbi:hypothetical protein MTO96_006939 [Rhipicephalus appendiculatus]
MPISTSSNYSAESTAVHEFARVRESSEESSYPLCTDSIDPSVHRHDIYAEFLAKAVRFTVYPPIYAFIKGLRESSVVRPWKQRAASKRTACESWERT